MRDLETLRKTDTLNLKHMIIENFIMWYTTIEADRDELSENLDDYMDNDHVDEIAELLGLPSKAKG